MLPFRGQWPRLGDRVFVADGAQVVGDVTVGDLTNIWYNAVLRGDMAAITVGDGCSIQDGCVVHVDRGMATLVGNHVVVGHNAIIHAATVGDDVLVGMNATVLSEANIGAGSIIGAGAVVPERREIPPRSLVLGIPGKAVREVTDDEHQAIVELAQHYVAYAAEHRATQEERG
ncbi:MAG: gamma carbonic anhydrase family protein [Dehalococcoidia bacterium]|nr:gamma carbonic anhydrase family protein [Dehalococcoidia bacterium]